MKAVEIKEMVSQEWEANGIHRSHTLTPLTDALVTLYEAGANKRCECLTPYGHRDESCTYYDECCARDAVTNLLGGDQ